MCSEQNPRPYQPTLAFVAKAPRVWEQLPLVQRQCCRQLLMQLLRQVVLKLPPPRSPAHEREN